jgi:hypothetical protein
MSTQKPSEPARSADYVVLPIEIVVAMLRPHVDPDREYDLARCIIEGLEARGWCLDLYAVRADD